jgi:AraC-like DNA-binding protein
MPRDRREKLVFGTFPDLSGVHFLSGWYVTDGFDAHLHEGFTIGVIVAGSEHFRCRGSDHIAEPGRIAVLNPEEVHKGGPGSEGWWTYRMIYPSPELMGTLCNDIVGSRGPIPWFPEILIRDPQLASTLAGLHEALIEGTSVLERQTLLLKALAALICRHASSPPSPQLSGTESKAVAQVKSYLEDNFQSAGSLDELSTLTGLSPFYLLRVFHRQVGMPPHAYLRHIRIARAESMLAKGMSVAEVALAAGFSDQSHMTRQFKRIVGITPGAYSRAISFKT